MMSANSWFHKLYISSKDFYNYQYQVSAEAAKGQVV